MVDGLEDGSDQHLSSIIKGKRGRDQALNLPVLHELGHHGRSHLYDLGRSVEVLLLSSHGEHSCSIYYTSLEIVTVLKLNENGAEGTGLFRVFWGGDGRS